MKKRMNLFTHCEEVQRIYHGQVQHRGAQGKHFKSPPKKVIFMFFRRFVSKYPMWFFLDVKVWIIARSPSSYVCRTLRRCVLHLIPKPWLSYEFWNECKFALMMMFVFVWRRTSPYLKQHLLLNQNLNPRTIHCGCNNHGWCRHPHINSSVWWDNLACGWWDNNSLVLGCSHNKLPQPYKMRVPHWSQRARQGQQGERIGRT